jgi:hypothetical protein
MNRGIFTIVILALLGFCSGYFISGCVAPPEDKNEDTPVEAEYNRSKKLFIHHPPEDSVETIPVSEIDSAEIYKRVKQARLEKERLGTLIDTSIQHNFSDEVQRVNVFGCVFYYHPGGYFAKEDCDCKPVFKDVK